MTTRERPVGIFDSGVGGLPYLAAARRALPAERYVYLADRAGFPYGTKSAEDVVRLAVGAIADLVRLCSPKAVVVACNTATELAIDEIRKANPGIPIVGTVPAIKPAAAMSRSKRIGVVATPGAVAAHYLGALASEWAADCELVKIGDGKLVDFVERRFLAASRDERLDAVRPSVEAMLASGVDVIVLGCTHFIHLAAEFAEVAGAGVAIVDSRDGVVSRLKSVMEPSGLEPGGVRRDEMYLTGSDGFGPVYAGFADMFGLSQSGTTA